MSENSLDIRIVSISATERAVSMRLPFQFGDTVVTETAEAFVAVKIETRGKIFNGLSAQLMVPRWFDKRPDQTNADTVNTLRQSILQACKSAKGLSGPTAHICTAINTGVLEKMPKVTPALAAGFGPALVEMALIDAVCQAAECNFFDGAHQDIFGLTERAGPGLSERMISQGLSSIRPKWTMQIRHTVS
ncbi:MAG: hypothetical protein JKY99_03025, partial [Rhizobiales bacterium]|nr:hypothetical protein [Hyphomicrobiales bacterium]